MKPLKKGMIIYFKSDKARYPNSRCWILLEVTKRDIKRGCNAHDPGLHAFGGMWYGRNPMKIKSYGKIDYITDIDDVVIVKDTIHGMSVDEIRKLVN